MACAERRNLESNGRSLGCTERGLWGSFLKGQLCGIKVLRCLGEGFVYG